MGNTLDDLIARAGARPRTLLALARTLLAKGRDPEARALAERCLKEAGSDPEVCALAAEIMSRGVPEWHFGIVRDEVRNAAYDAALKRAVKPGMRVLDIGAGTGLLAMMAARAGAAHVISCEMNPVVAEAARAVIARNGYADRIHVVAKHSSDLDAETDMGGAADLLVSEIVSNDLLGEAALPAHEQAVRRLLKPGAPIIPATAWVRVALARDAQANRRTMGNAAGFDLTPFNRLAPRRYRLSVGEKDLVLKSEPADAARFDFQSGGPFPEGQTQTRVHATESGANGIVQWIALAMDGEGRYENRPSAGATSCWAAHFHPFPEHFRPLEGEAVTVVCAHDRHTLRIWAHKG